MNSISFLVPIRNGEQYLPSILTALELNYKPQDEIIIIDDNSTDQTHKILLDFQYRAVSLDVRIFKNFGNGLVDALNFGFRVATKSWVARFDADDIYPSYRIDFQRKLIQSSIAVIFSDYYLKSESGVNLGYIPSAIFSPSTEISLLSSNRTPHSSALVNRSIFLLAGGYRKEEFPAEDLGLWLRMSHFGKLISCPHILLEYRVGKGSISALKNKEMKERKKQILAQEKLQDKIIQEFSNSFLKNFHSYGNFNYPFERKLLSLNDLWQVKRNGYHPPRVYSLTIQSALLLAIDPRALIALLKLFRHKVLRRQMRKSIQARS